jgi:hypothetical protein
LTQSSRKRGLEESEESRVSGRAVPPKTTRRRRILRLAVVTLVGLELLYLVGAQVFLWSEWGRGRINRRPERLLVSWESALSPLPGLVRIRGAEIRGQNRKSQWLVRVDKSWVWIDLARLPRRAFHTWSLRARGAEFWLRENAFDADSVRSEPDALPPIPGLELPTTTPLERLMPRHPNRRPWRLRFGGLRVRELRDLWLGRYRLRAATEVDGGLAFAIRGELESRGIRLRVAEGTLLDGEETPVATGMLVDARLRVDPFDPGETPAAEIFEKLDGSIGVQAHVMSLGFLDPFLARAQWLDLEAEGPLEAQLEIEGGEIQPGTTFRVQAMPLVATVAGHRVRGAGLVEGSLGADILPGGAPAGRVDLRFEHFTVHTPSGRELARGDGFAIELLTDQRAIGKHTDVRATIDLPSSEIPDLGALDEYLPAPAGLDLQSGSGTLALHLEVDQPSRSGHGRIEASVADAVGEFGGTGFRGDLVLTAELDDIDATTRSLTVAPAVLRLDEVALDPGGGDTDWTRVAGDWWGELQLARGRFDFAEGWRARGDLSLHLKDNLPVLAVFVERKAFLAWFHGLLEAQDITGAAKIDVAKRYLRIEDLVIDSDHIQIAGDLTMSEPKRKEGLLFAKFRALSVAVELFADGERDWKLTHSRRWFEARRAERRAP